LVATATSDASRSCTAGDDGDAGDAQGRICTRLGTDGHNAARGSGFVAAAFGFLGFVLLYQMISSPVSLLGYLQEITHHRARW
jgi:hypothetical protein